MRGCDQLSLDRHETARCAWIRYKRLRFQIALAKRWHYVWALIDLSFDFSLVSPDHLRLLFRTTANEVKLQQTIGAARARPDHRISIEEQNYALREIVSWPSYAPTPLDDLRGLSNCFNVDSIWYKDEAERFGLGSFKALGGAYAALRILQRELEKAIGRRISSKELRTGEFQEFTRRITLTTATDGNHGRSVAWAASLFGCRSVIYVPQQCSTGREVAIRGYGATVVRTTSGYDATVRQCVRDAERDGFFVVSDTSWPDYFEIPSQIMAGYTVMLAEALDQLKGNRPTHVFVQCGVGGLAGAVSEFLVQRFEPIPSVVVVEPEHAACMFASAIAGKPVRAPEALGTVMAGLDCAEVSMLAWEILSRRANAFMTIPDSSATLCMRVLKDPPLGDLPIVAGESGVAGLAALLLAASHSHLRAELRLDEDSRILVFGTEGATDPEVYNRLLKHGFS